MRALPSAHALPIPASLRERGNTLDHTVDSAPPIPTTRRPNLATRSSTRSSNCSAETSPPPPRHRPTPRPHHRVRRCVQDKLQRLGGRSLLAGDFYILNRLKAGPSLGSVGLNLRAIWKQHRAQRQKAERQRVMKKERHGSSGVGHRASGVTAATTVPARAEGWKQGTKEKPAGASARAKGAVGGRSGGASEQYSLHGTMKI